MRAVVLAVAAALVTGSIPGCSYVFVTPPLPTELRGPLVHCTTSDAMPVVDMLVAGVQLVRFLLAFSASDADFASSTISRIPTLIIDGSTVFLFGVSSGYGFSLKQMPRNPGAGLRPRSASAPGPASASAHERGSAAAR